MGDDRDLQRRWVQTWIRAGEELDAIWQRELQSVDTQEAVRQLFGDGAIPTEPSPTISGLVEQQRLFARLRK